jgi:hypothetical protein
MWQVAVYSKSAASWTKASKALRCCRKPILGVLRSFSRRAVSRWVMSEMDWKTPSKQPSFLKIRPSIVKLRGSMLKREGR